MPTPQVPPATAPPLTPEQLASLQQVGDAYRVLRRTATAAAFSGITALTLGVGSMSCVAISPDAMGILATAVLMTVGIVELAGRQRLLAGRPDALKWLALNQLAFLAAITLYC